MNTEINKEKKIVPSYPAPDFEKLSWLFDSLRGVTDEIQVDIVDGVFAPFTSWPFTEQDHTEALKKLAAYSPEFKIEMDCMVREPERFLDLFVDLGIARVVVHMRSTEKYEAILEHAQTHGYTLGFALVNDVPLSELDPYIDRLDFVQLMGIAHVGQQGQPFDERTLTRVRELRAKYPALEIAVDGAVNENTIQALSEAGVNRFEPGSAITRAEDPKIAFATLQDLIS